MILAIPDREVATFPDAQDIASRRGALVAVVDSRLRGCDATRKITAMNQSERQESSRRSLAAPPLRSER